ncbi:MAG: nucleotidyl transferase AbiEii/AbiGii toxin family protein [Streptosporangiaceae bacterium]
MNVAEGALRQAAADLDGAGAAWAVIGGFAVGARAEPRFTRDVDVAVAVASDAEAEQLVHRLQVRGYAVGAILEHEQAGRLATVRLVRPSPGARQVFIDLLFASSGIEDQLVRQAGPVELLPGFIVPVAAVGHLIALKLLARDDARRPNDLADLNALIAVAAPEDLNLARTAVTTITERGFHRDRDLRAALEEFISAG